MEPTTAPDVVSEWVLPSANPKWHDVARIWWEALPHSGQSAFYTATDWAAAYAIAESMSREFKPQPIVIDDTETGKRLEWVERPPSGAALGSWLKGMSGLLAMEGDRRRVSLELQRAKPGAEEVSDVSELARYRQRLQSS